METPNKQATDSSFSCGPGFGSASLSGEGGGYGFGRIEERLAQQILMEAWDLGVRVFDTAPIYGYGLAEERLGRYLPPEALLINKGGISWHSNKRVNLTNDPQVIEAMFYSSLKRLGREKIHGYMIHWPDPKVDIRKPYEVLLRLKESRLVDCIGLSNPCPNDLAKILDFAPLDVVQLEASFFEPSKLRALTQALKTPPAQRSPWVTGWGTLGKGLLTGRVYKGRQFDKEDARSWAPWWKNMNIQKLAEDAKPFLSLAQELSLQPATLAFIYSADVLGVHCPLMGLKTPSDLDFLIELNQLPSEKREAASQALQSLKRTY